MVVKESILVAADGDFQRWQHIQKSGKRKDFDGLMPS
jgi:hypothetical protein